MEVRYMMSGKAHMPYLITSLYTLREHWKGPVIVYAWPRSFDVAQRVAEDKSLDIEARVWEPEPWTVNGRKTHKTAQFAEKIRMMQTGEGKALYLDADTIINTGFENLIEESEDTTFLATQFCNWTTGNGIIQNRMKRLYDYPRVTTKEVVDLVIEKRLPSPNGGVFLCDTNSPILPLWHMATVEAKDIFIADETVLQLFAFLVNEDEFKIHQGGTWQKVYKDMGHRRPHYNASPKWPEIYTNDTEIAIWHGHGDCFTRYDKSQYGVKLWTSHYEICLRENIGGVQEWQVGCFAEHKYLKKALSGSRIDLGALRCQ